MQTLGKTLVNKAVVMAWLLIFAIALCYNGAEAATVKIGYVDLTVILAQHPYSQNIKQLTQNLEEELKKRQEELNKQGKGLDETELKKLEEKFNSEWEPIKQKILSEIQSYQAARYANIIESIKAVGENGKYDLILSSEMNVSSSGISLNYPIILYGGENITQDVINEVLKRVEEEQKAKK
ncbi:MAG: hypothetical protein Kow00103_14560 [Candidatus Caldatribacteriota bacterium]